MCAGGDGGGKGIARSAKNQPESSFNPMVRNHPRDKLPRAVPGVSDNPSAAAAEQQKGRSHRHGGFRHGRVVDPLRPVSKIRLERNELTALDWRIRQLKAR